MTLTIPTPPTTAEIIDLIRHPQPGKLLLAAHRGLRGDRVPENSRASIRNAFRQGCLCVEIDVQLTSDGHIVLLHDEGLGRTTNIAEHLGRTDVYSPFSGKGYHPRVDETKWKGCIEHLRIKDEYGNISDEPVIELHEMLEFIKAEGLDIVVFLDFKCKEAMAPTATVLKKFENAKGVPALQWCVFKPDIKFIANPAELEHETWWAEAAAGGGWYLPVLEPPATYLFDVLESAKQWASRPYVLALEVGLRGLNGPLQDVVDWAKSPEGPSLAIGFFAALGDLCPRNGAYAYDLGDYDIRAKQDPNNPRAYIEWAPIGTFEDLLLPGESPSGRDERGDIETWSKLGYSWVIADPVSAIKPILAYQGDLVSRESVNGKLPN